MSAYDNDGHQCWATDALDDLMLDVRDLIEGAYFEREPGGKRRAIVRTIDLEGLCERFNKIWTTKGGGHQVPEPRTKAAPSEAMREALEWILQPDHAIGSNAEMLRKSEEKARAALEAPCP